MGEQEVKKKEKKKPVDLTVVPQRIGQRGFEQQIPKVEQPEVARETKGIKLAIVPRKAEKGEVTIIEQAQQTREVKEVERLERVEVKENALAIAYKKAKEILYIMQDNIVSIPAALKEFVDSLGSIVRYSERVLMAGRERPKTIADLMDGYSRSSGNNV